VVCAAWTEKTVREYTVSHVPLNAKPNALAPRNVVPMWGATEVLPDVALVSIRTKPNALAPRNVVPMWGATEVLPDVALVSIRTKPNALAPRNVVPMWGVTPLLSDVALVLRRTKKNAHAQRKDAPMWGAYTILPDVALVSIGAKQSAHAQRKDAPMWAAQEHYRFVPRVLIPRTGKRNASMMDAQTSGGRVRNAKSAYTFSVEIAKPRDAATRSRSTRSSRSAGNAKWNKRKYLARNAKRELRYTTENVGIVNSYATETDAPNHASCPTIFATNLVELCGNENTKSVRDKRNKQ
jgi:hypothetical protein